MRESLRFFKKNKLQILSTLLSLIISFVGIICTVILFNYVTHLKDNLEDKVQIVAFIDKESKNTEQIIVDKIKTIDNVDKVTYNSANKELDNLINEISDDSEIDTTFEDIKKDNPLQDVVYIKINDKSKINTVAKDLETIPDIDTIEYNKEATNIYLKSLNLLWYVGIASVIIMILLTFPNLVSLLNSGIKMRKTELRIKRLVGASKFKIMSNFIIELGIIFIIALIITSIISNYLINMVQNTISHLGLSFLDISNTNSMWLESNYVVIIVGIILAITSLIYAFILNHKY